MKFPPLFQQAYSIARGRIRVNWRTEGILFFGILLATTLMASGVTYSQFLSNATLRQTLKEASHRELNFVIHPFYSTNPVQYEEIQHLLKDRIINNLLPYIRGEALHLETEPFYFKGSPQLELDNGIRPRGTVNYISGLEARADIIEGRWPEEGQRPIEVAVDQLGAKLLQASVGDQITLLRPRSPDEDPRPKVRIIGIFRRAVPQDEYWFGLQRSFSSRHENWDEVPLFTTRYDLFQELGAQDGTLYPQPTWFFYLDRSKVEVSNVKSLKEAVMAATTARKAILPDSLISTSLVNVLVRYENQILFARIPLFLLIFLSTAVLIIYLILLSLMAVKQRANEIALLTSRGATRSQLGLMSFIEISFLAVPAIAIGPFLATGIVSILDSLFFVKGTGTSAIVYLTSEAFLLSAAGGVLSIAVFTSITILQARKSVVELWQELARPRRALLFHRYFLDLAALGIIALLWWQIRSRDSFLVRLLEDGDLQIDYSMLLSPALGILALGLIVLRFFPIVIGFLIWATTPVGSPWLVQNLRGLSRDPIMPGILIVLVMMSTALVVAASIFGPSIERNQKERALYAVGADARVEISQAMSNDILDAGDAERLPEIKVASITKRINGRLMTTGFTAPLTALAIDTTNFAKVAWYRPDFASPNLDQLTNLLSSEEHYFDGIPLPRNTTSLALWINPTRPNYSGIVKARLSDSQGLFFDVDIGRLDFIGWKQLEKSIDPVQIGKEVRSLRSFKFSEPFTLHAILFMFGHQSSESSVIFLDRLTAITTSGQETLAEFQTWDGWSPLQDYSRPGIVTLEPSESVGRDGRGSAMYATSPGGSALRGLLAGQPQFPIPAIVSRSLLNASDAALGDTLTISLNDIAVPIQVMAQMDYFPTLDPNSEPFVIMNVTTLNRFMNYHGPPNSQQFNELWIRLNDHKGMTTPTIAALTVNGFPPLQVHNAQEMITDRLSHPLIVPGWTGLLVLLFAGMGLVGASGVLAFFQMNLRERQTELALLRTLGLSSGQLKRMLWFNLFLLVICGLGLGTLLGHLMSSALLLPALRLGGEGIMVTPPIVLEIGWLTLLPPTLALLVTSCITIPWIVSIASRIETKTALRIG